MLLTSGTLQPNFMGCLEAAGVIGAWAQDTTTGRVVADPNVAWLFGVADPDTANGDRVQRYVEAIHPADRRMFKEAITTASRNGTPIALQYRVVTPDGVRWLHDYGSFSLGADGQPQRGQGIVIDTTVVLARHEAGVLEEVVSLGPPNPLLQTRINQLSAHVIATSEIARALPSRRLQALTDPLLWEVGRLLGWITRRR